MTPMHYSLSGSCVTSAKVLLEKGANLRAKDTEGKTPVQSMSNWSPGIMKEILPKIDSSFEISDFLIREVATIEEGAAGLDQLLSRLGKPPQRLESELADSILNGRKLATLEVAKKHGIRFERQKVEAKKESILKFGYPLKREDGDFFAAALNGAD
jgi:hypothetical protein